MAFIRSNWITIFIHAFILSGAVITTADSFVPYRAGTTVTEGDTVKVTADGWMRGTDDVLSRYMIRFYSDSLSILPFSFAPRFNQMVVVRNSFSGGSWGAEERGGGMQLTSSKTEPIVLFFTLTDTQWQVSYMKEENRIPDYDFAHRLPQDVNGVDIQNLINGQILIRVGIYKDNETDSSEENSDFIIITSHDTKYVRVYQNDSVAITWLSVAVVVLFMISVILTVVLYKNRQKGYRNVNADESEIQTEGQQDFRMTETGQFNINE